MRPSRFSEPRAIALLSLLLIGSVGVRAQERYRLGDLFSPPAHAADESWLVRRTVSRSVETTLFPAGAETEGEVIADASTEREVFVQKVTRVDGKGRIEGALRFYREATMEREEGGLVEMPHNGLYAVYGLGPEGEWSMSPYRLVEGLRRGVRLDEETERRLLEDAPSRGDDWTLVAGALADKTLTVGTPEAIDPGLLLATFDWTQLVRDGETLPEETRLQITLVSVTPDTVTLAYSGGLGLRGRDPDNDAEIVVFIELEPMTMTYRRAPFQRIAIDATAGLGLYGKLEREGSPHEIKGKGRFVLRESVNRP